MPAGNPELPAGAVLTPSTRGLAIKTEPKCKICTSPHRGDIEDHLAMRSAGESVTLPDGTQQRVTEKWLFSVAEEKWGMRLNSANLTIHFKKHFEVGNPAEMVAAQTDAAAELLYRVQRGEIEKATADEALDLIITIGTEKIRQAPGTVTVDHVLKAVAEKTKRKHDESRDRLMETLGGAVAAVAVASVHKEPPKAEVEAEAAEVVEAEVVDGP